MTNFLRYTGDKAFPTDRHTEKMMAVKVVYCSSNFLFCSIFFSFSNLSDSEDSNLAASIISEGGLDDYFQPLPCGQF